MAPQEKPIDWNRVDIGLMAGCTQEEIAGELKINRDTLRDRFKAYYGIDWSAYSAQLQQSGEVHLKVAQFQKALNNNAKGNTQMLIWLGKVRLGQKEPEAMSGAVPEQINLDKDHRLMMLEHELATLKGMNANKPEAE